MDGRFPKANLIHFEFHRPLRIGGKLYLKPLYNRLANAGRLSVPFLCMEVVWRMPWLPHAAYSKGWDACWRQQNGLGK